MRAQATLRDDLPRFQVSEEEHRVLTTPFRDKEFVRACCAQRPRGAMTSATPAPRGIVFGSLLWIWVLSSPGAAAAQGQLWQLNSGGDDLHVIDTSKGSIIRRLDIGPEPHGVAAPDDFDVVYVTLEANGRERGELLWVDPSTYRVRERLEVGPEPHEIATTPDGRWIYVPCRDGRYWVVDGRERRVVKRIFTGGRPHNTVASDDGRYMYLAPMGEPERITVVDVNSGHEVVGRIEFGGSLRPLAVSHRRGLLFQQIDGLNGFRVADLVDERVVATVEHSNDLGWFLLPMEKLGWLGWSGLRRCHGLAVRPGKKEEIWATCGNRVNIHSLDRPDFPELASLELSDDAYWLTFSPDGRYGFVALSDAGRVVMIDAAARRQVRVFEAGEDPKRNLLVPGPEPAPDR